MPQLADAAKRADDIDTDTISSQWSTVRTPKSPGSAPGPIEPPAPAAPAISFTDRYQPRKLLGKGGMGEVRLCKDAVIGREVAMKALLPLHASEPDMRARFLREAQVQGQLEHPAIVPVYDLGQSPDGAVFFTMKRLRGMTLSQVIEGLGEERPDVVEAFPRRKLLTAFCSVCLAVDFAHARGVLHRDLKPANIMLGDFGEVYVLDWGIARVRGAEEVHLPEADVVPSARPAETGAGSMLGTLGYMSPEQGRGMHAQLDARSDVFSLGAILFELLTLTRLRPKGDLLETLLLMRDGADARASVRAPDRSVPPELEAICVRATATDPGARFASARELCGAVERFLDGDRDIELRRQMADGYAREASDAAEKALAAGEGSEDARRQALREVGRALALEPTNEAAMRALVRVITEPPREVPRELEADLERAARGRDEVRLGSIAWSSLLATVVLLPCLLWMGVRSLSVAALVGVSNGAMLLLRRASTRPNARVWLRYATHVAILMVYAASARIFGPLFFVTVPLALHSVMQSMGDDPRYRRFVIVSSCGLLLGMLALELFGVVQPSYAFRDGAMMILPNALHLPATPTLVTLTAAALFGIAIPAMHVSKMPARLREAEQRLMLQTWHLSQLLPEGARAPIAESARPAVGREGPCSLMHS